MFDPNFSYVLGATESESGRMYEQLQDLEQNFPDVYACYLQDYFDLEHGSIIRLPLRTLEMTEKSQIMKQPTTKEGVKKLFLGLQKEAPDILLLTNNLEKISVSEFDEETGKLKLTFLKLN